MPMKHSTQAQHIKCPNEKTLNIIKAFARLYNSQLNNEKEALFFANSISCKLQLKIN